MSKGVRREIIDKWIDERYPNALTKLSNASSVPAASISKIRTGRVPTNELTRRSLAKALGVQESELFPVVPSRKGKAS